MVKKIFKWVRQHYFTIVNSIAFYPVLIALGFLLLAYFFLLFDFSDLGRDLKESFRWMNLKDSSTARTIIATVAAGIISLAVFSFSMVMILLNQAAVNMSNRILDNMIGNRYHQAILGFYVGTIVYAFCLLSTIRDIDSGLHIPSLSIYFLILLTIIDIFLFIYFLHYITQSVKYETIINRIYDNTLDSLQENYTSELSETTKEDIDWKGQTIYTNRSGYFQGFALKSLMEFCEEHDYKIAFPHTISTYLIKGTPLATVVAEKELTEEHINRILMLTDVYRTQTDISRNPYFGCKQLTEVAVKALSPGVNDPGTAILSINRLADLLSYRICHYPQNIFKDDNDNVRIYVQKHSFEQYFIDCFYPIWDYGKNDRLVLNAFENVLNQMENAFKDNHYTNGIKDLLNNVQLAISKLD